MSSQSITIGRNSPEEVVGFLKKYGIKSIYINNDMVSINTGPHPPEKRPNTLAESPKARQLSEKKNTESTTSPAQGAADPANAGAAAGSAETPAETRPGKADETTRQQPGQKTNPGVESSPETANLTNAPANSKDNTKDSEAPNPPGGPVAEHVQQTQQQMGNRCFSAPSAPYQCKTRSNRNRNIN